jgi:hypothetical protein
MSLVYSSGASSLFVQIITGLIDIYVLTKPIQGPLRFVKQLLWVETGVQVVEASFYIWLVSNLHRTNITRVRYYDWIITTPTMLFTYIMYLLYIHKKTHQYSLYDTASYHIVELLPIFALNTLMLFFGYLAEIGKFSAMAGASLGFLPFFAMFAWIYFAFAKESALGRTTFWYFSIVWGLYGFAAIFPYKFKNTAYNILDIFSKNFFGLFLAFTLWR